MCWVLLWCPFFRGEINQALREGKVTWLAFQQRPACPRCPQPAGDSKQNQGTFTFHESQGYYHLHPCFQMTGWEINPRWGEESCLHITPVHKQTGEWNQTPLFRKKINYLRTVKSGAWHSPQPPILISNMFLATQASDKPSFDVTTPA